MNKKKILLLIVLVLVVAGSLAGMYLWKIKPIQTEVANKRIELKNEEAYLKAIQGKNPSSTEINVETSVELQKKLPVEPLVHQLVLDLQKAEVVSNSTIKNMSIAEETKTEEGEDLSTRDYNNFNLQEEAEKQADKENQTQSQTQSVALIAGLQKVTISMNVQSPTYMELQAFLASIESMNRIMKVDSLTFAGEEELISIEQTRKPLTYSIVVSAYYAPVLNDLVKDLPQMELTKPSEKTNPFSTSPATE